MGKDVLEQLFKFVVTSKKLFRPLKTWLYKSASHDFFNRKIYKHEAKLSSIVAQVLCSPELWLGPTELWVDTLLRALWEEVKSHQFSIKTKQEKR